MVQLHISLAGWWPKPLARRLPSEGLFIYGRNKAIFALLVPRLVRLAEGVRPRVE